MTQNVRLLCDLRTVGTVKKICRDLGFDCSEAPLNSDDDRLGFAAEAAGVAVIATITVAVVKAVSAIAVATIQNESVSVEVAHGDHRVKIENATPEQVERLISDFPSPIVIVRTKAS